MSHPGGVTNYDTFDKKAELHGILKFSAINSRVQESIEHYIDGNLSPVQRQMTGIK